MRRRDLRRDMMKQTRELGLGLDFVNNMTGGKADQRERIKRTYMWMLLTGRSEKVPIRVWFGKWTCWMLGVCGSNSKTH